MIKISAFLVLASFVLIACPALEAKDSGCTALDFTGTYGFLVSGVISPGLPVSGDFSRLGKVVADGKGNTVATTLADYNGNNVEEDFPGTYTVSDNCHLTWKAVLPTGALAVTFDGAITGTGQVFVFVSSPGGSILQGVLEKQKTGGCLTSDVTGGYALRLGGQMDFGLPLVGPYGRVGQLTFDGAGGVYIDTIVSYAGALLREQFKGTYAVGDNCHLTLNAKLPWPLLFGITEEGVLSADNTHLLMMQTAPSGSTITGDLRKQ